MLTAPMAVLEATVVVAVVVMRPPLFLLLLSYGNSGDGALARIAAVPNRAARCDGAGSPSPSPKPCRRERGIGGR